ncbi:MAG: Daunorubicin/doxorubicin resistance ATP-binding protein DrrA [Anaerolineales bacterium]|nr:Daunorubicin/doxorubicin resistance ATP-binding protein DrrA [Anaerolineales bacterium]
MSAIDADGVTKRYGHFEAVKDLSFSVQSGEIFGLRGPNGAGKTSTIRMLMDIIKPDAGRIWLLGESPSAATKNRIGYLPEERGLYKGLRVMDTLVYLAALKDVPRDEAEQRAEALLRRVNLWSNRQDKISALSKGMQQKLQFVVTILHDPDLVVLDEPFQGLDPINTELIQEMIAALPAQGKTVILSTHMMNQVEQLCDRILLMDHGRSVLYGRLDDIKQQFANNAVILRAAGDFDNLHGVRHVNDHGRYYELILEDEATPQDVLRQLVQIGTEVREFEVAKPALNEIFIEVVGNELEIGDLSPTISNPRSPISKAKRA